MIKIEPLTKKYVTQACNLGNLIFSYEEILSSKAIGANLDPKKYKKLESIYKEVVSTESFVAIDKEKVIGVVGLYKIKEDVINTFWLGWFFVDPNIRGKGIGGLLLDYAIGEAKKRGTKYLKLYTSNHPNEKIAQILYKKRGFKITKRELLKDGMYRIFYQKKLL